MRDTRLEIDVNLRLMSVLAGALVWTILALYLRRASIGAQLGLLVLFVAWCALWLYQLRGRRWLKPINAPFWLKVLQLALITPVTGAMIGFIVAAATR